ncbi:phage tail protein [Mesorhizobium sp. M1B.F.Ca.ET.045.04.1.1]|uniref:phage tail protein n=1 Tax=Mesorhizobium sp. M1B.F.Ca.ET.045.04.1.1 TaxID=2493673 RepID=UPI000F74E786|nr:phage tail protein [Mesorhizobium sp. M1B.F.Ca.ET.045.04.1.1]AZO29434.1 hypothetical protein EJ071_19915 [Mesorhizobium sp. M1B.F.Ca.ET.045.04.1.1]
MALPGTQVTVGHWVQTPLPPRVDDTITRRTGLVTPPAIGRPKAAVIGTGRVDGIPVYGQAKTVTTTYKGYRVGSEFYLTYPEPTTVATIDVVYLLARDYFGRGYDIIRIEADGEVVFDAENGAIPRIEFRFYNGLQTTVDPVVQQIVGANAGAHTGDVLLVLPDYPAGQAPTITAVISNAATDNGSTQEIAWIGAAPDTMMQAHLHACYDPVDAVIYQVLTGLEISGTECMLSVLDAVNHVELYRVGLEDSAFYFGGSAFVNATLPGSGYLVVRFALSGELNSPTRVYNVVTGQIVAEWREASNQSIVWSAAEAFGNIWVMVGDDLDTSGGQFPVFATIDIALGTIDVFISPVDYTSTVGSGGRVSTSSASFFVRTGNTITEAVFDGDGWIFQTAYQGVGTITGLHYDPLTEYLLVLEEIPSGTFNVYLVTPDTGSIAEAFTISLRLFPLDGIIGKQENSYPRPGYALFSSGSSSEDLWAIDIIAHTATKLADVNSETGQQIDYGFYDQARLSYFMAAGDTVWTEYTIPGTTPGQITTRNHILDLITVLGPYMVDHVRFSGFEGLSDWGDVIDKDTSIRTLLRTYQDPLGFVWSDVGNEIVFRKTPTDGSFVVDEALADTDLVFKANGSIISDDDSDLTRVARVTLEYTSKEDNYQQRTVYADSFDELYDVTRSTKEVNFSTSMVLSDADGERLVWEILWRQQAKERAHRFSTFSDFAHLIPGDVISVPSGDITYTVELAKVNIKENLVIEFEARDFQTSLSADVAAVSNSGFSGINSVSLQSQYVHLDIPLLRYADDAGGTSLVQYGVVAGRGQPNWGGGSLYRGDTANAFAVMYDQAPHTAFIGSCATALPDNPNPFAGDFSSSIVVRKISGDAPTAATEAEVMLGSNLAFVGKEGRWEGLGFTTVVDNGDGTYTMSGFPVRGWRGTEVYGGQHEAGDLFVLISPEWVKKLLHPTTDLDLTKFYKAVGFGGSLASAVAIAHAIPGAAEKPYAVVNIASELSVGDTVVTFDYRSRLSAWEMFSSAPDCGEATLAFEIDVMDAGSPNTALHTYPVTANEWTYTAAQKVTDWGTPPAEATIRIYMISAVAGRGHVAEAIIPL